MKSLNKEMLINYLVPALTFVVIVALVPLVIFPQLTKIKEQNDAIRVKDQRLTKLNAKLDFLQNLKNNKDLLEEKINNVEVALPSGKGVAPLVEGLKKVASASNLILDSIRLTPGKVASASAKTVASKEVNSLSFAINLTGKVVDFEGFVSKLERAKRILLIEKLQSSFNADGTGTFNLNIRSPFKPVQNQGTSSDQVAESIPSQNAQEQKLYDTLVSDFILYSSEVKACDSCTGSVTNPFP